MSVHAYRNVECCQYAIVHIRHISYICKHFNRVEIPIGTVVLRCIWMNTINFLCKFLLFFRTKSYRPVNANLPVGTRKSEQSNEKNLKIKSQTIAFLSDSRSQTNYIKLKFAWSKLWLNKTILLWFKNYE